MIGFKEFNNTKPSYKYVAVIYDADSQKKLRQWAIDAGFDLSVDYDGSQQDVKKFEFHTTIFFTTNQMKLPNRRIKMPKTSVTITGLKMLGSNKDVPVLKVSADGGIMKLRKKYEEMGMEDKWPSYVPHISVSYAKSNIDIRKIKIPDFKPTYNEIVIKDAII
jgi:hypothetical protein